MTPAERIERLRELVAMLDALIAEHAPAPPPSVVVRQIDEIEREFEAIAAAEESEGTDAR